MVLTISIEHAAATDPEAIAIRANGRAHSFADARELARGVDSELRPLPAPFVSRVLGSDVESVLALMRAFSGGASLVALHPKYTESVVASRLAPFESMLPEAVFARDRAAQEDVALVVFTSGTSGVGSPVLLTRAALAAAAEASIAVLDLRRGDRFHLSMPLAHVGGASIVARCVAARASVVVGEAGGSFDAKSWGVELLREGVTHASIVPTMLRRIVDAGVVPPPSLRRLVVGGAACDDALARRAIAAGYPVVRTYGMTETSAMATCEAHPGEGGVGRPLPGVEVRIAAEAHESSGELRVRSRGLAAGIYPNRELSLDDDGFLRTRDVGSIDASGVVRVHGRLDDVIVTGGENVHPADVEAALLAIDGVDAAVVFGSPDPDWGARVVAVFSGTASADALSSSTRTSLPAFARPKRYVRADALPTLPSGKVDRRAAIELARAIDERAR